MNAAVPGPGHRRGLPAIIAGLGALLAVLPAGCALGAPEPEPAAPLPPAGQPGRQPEPPEVHEVIATGLEIPWDVDFLPGGTALVTERASGQIWQVGPAADAGGWPAEVVQTIEGVNHEGEGGLLGIAVSPAYEVDGWIFAFHSAETENRIIRFQLGEEPEPIVTGIPHDRIHNGGGLAFGPDGYLYATVGDGNAPESAPDPADLRGTVLRMTIDGDPAPDNPFASLVWAYGLRNPQGLAWDGWDRLWVTEFGADELDEVNLVERGANLGWPTCEGPCTPADPDLVDPVVTWPPDQASCAGAAATGNVLIAACLRGQRLWLMELTGSGTILGAPQPLLVETYGRLRAAAVAPDGSLWLTTSNRDGRLPGGAREGDDRIIRMILAGVGTAGAA